MKIDVGKPRRRTGFVYDEIMTQHWCIWDPDHIEVPQRLSGSFDELTNQALLNFTTRLTSRDATKSELCLAHDESYLNFLQGTSRVKDNESGSAELRKAAEHMEDVYFCKETYGCAIRSAGCTLESLEAIMTGKVDNAFALVRPPGHHASASESCGFCFFNNVVLASRLARRKFDCKKVAIVDFDVHHGQGTQYLVEDDPNILYISMHRYERGKFWPNLPESNYDCVGPTGTTINLPLNSTGCSDADYVLMFTNVVLPILTEFAPDLVVVSAGYDCMLGDPQGEMKVTPAGVAFMVNSLTAWKSLFVLEGGYFLPSLYAGVAMTVRALLGLPCPSPSLGRLKKDVADVIYALASRLSQWWQSMADLISYLDQIWPEPDLKELQYIGEREWAGRPEPYPLVGLYPRRSEAVECHFQQLLALEVSCYKDRKCGNSTLLIADEIFAPQLSTSVNVTTQYLRQPSPSTLPQIAQQLLQPLTSSTNSEGHHNFILLLQPGLDVSKLWESGHHERPLHLSVASNAQAAQRSSPPKSGFSLQISVNPNRLDDFSVDVRENGIHLRISNPFDPDWSWVLNQLVLPVCLSVQPDITFASIDASMPIDIAAYFAHAFHLMACGRNCWVVQCPPSVNPSTLLNTLSGAQIPPKPQVKGQPVNPYLIDVTKTAARHLAESLSSEYFKTPMKEMVIEIPDHTIHAVVPLSECPHMTSDHILDQVPAIDFKAKCLECGNQGENWICMKCGEVHCGRFVSGHGVHHYEQSGHSISLSFADLSAWCYPCDSYVHGGGVLLWKAVAEGTKFS